MAEIDKIIKFTDSDWKASMKRSSRKSFSGFVTFDGEGYNLFAHSDAGELIEFNMIPTGGSRDLERKLDNLSGREVEFSYTDVYQIRKGHSTPSYTGQLLTIKVIPHLVGEAPVSITIPLDTD